LTIFVNKKTLRTENIRTGSRHGGAILSVPYWEGRAVPSGFPAAIALKRLLGYMPDLPPCSRKATLNETDAGWKPCDIAAPVRKMVVVSAMP